MKSSKTISALMLCSAFVLFSAVAQSHEMPAAPDSMPGMNHDMPGMDHAMSLGPKDEYFDLRFIDAMILHHQGALRMAEEALEKSDRISITRLARQITLDQRRELRRMQQWRETWYPYASGEPMMYSAEMNHMMPMPADVQAAMRMDVDLGASDDEFDLRFINAMIMHHEGAIAMAGEALAQSDRLNIRRLARGILRFQQQEIAQMRNWRSQWY